MLASIQLCEAYHKVRRLGEERLLLTKELTQYVRYCEERIHGLCNTLSAVQSGQRPLAEVLGAADVQSEHRYFCASAFEVATGSPVLARIPQAVCALLRAGIAEYNTLLSLARQSPREQVRASASPMEEAMGSLEADASETDTIMSDDSES